MLTFTTEKTLELPGYPRGQPADFGVLLRMATRLVLRNRRQSPALLPDADGPVALHIGDIFGSRGRYQVFVLGFTLVSTGRSLLLSAPLLADCARTRYLWPSTASTVIRRRSHLGATDAESLPFARLGQLRP